MWPTCLQCEAPEVEEVPVSPVPALIVGLDALTEEGLSFDERLSQHLAALHSVLLEEHERLVVRLCHTRQNNEKEGNGCQTVEDGFSKMDKMDKVEHGSSNGCNSRSSSKLQSEKLAEGFDQAEIEFGVRSSVLSVETVLEPQSGLRNSQTRRRVSQRIVDKRVDVFGQDVEEVFEDILKKVNTQALKEVKGSWAWSRIRCTGKDFHFVIGSDEVVQSIMDFVVISNIIVLGFQAGSRWNGWAVFDGFYALMYSVEIMYKLGVQGCFYLNPRKNADFRWTLFDICLACLSIFDFIISWIATSNKAGSNYTWMRIARLVRLARILRLIKLGIFKDLLLMINGAVGGLRTLAWSIVMITVPLYVFALFFTEMIGMRGTGAQDDAATLFNSISMSMFTGFRCLVAGECVALDGTPIFLQVVRQYGWVYGVIYSLTSVCMSFGLFNVIIAIYVENTVAAAKSNELVQRQRRLEDQRRFAEKILNMVHFLWNQLHRGSDGNDFILTDALEMEISEEHFNRLVHRPEMRSLLGDLDVPKEDYKDLFEICDTNGHGVVSMAELMSGVRRLRGDPRRSDLVYVMLRINKLIKETHHLKKRLGSVSPSEEEEVGGWRNTVLSED